MKPLARWTIVLLVSAAALAQSCNNQTTTPPQPALPGGGVMSWGGNTAGQLGDGSNSQRLNPVLLNLQSVKAVAAGGNGSTALTTDGRVYTWGEGQTTPSEVTALQGATAVAEGRAHRLALMPGGTVRAWGENAAGQLGDNSATARPSPVQVVGLSGMRAIAAGGDQSYAIASDLGLYAWGSNTGGQLGDGSKNGRPTPVRIGTFQVIEVKASANHALALSSNVEGMGWGGNQTCQLMQNPRNNPFDPIVCSEHLSPAVLMPFYAPGISSKGDALAASLTSSFFVMSNGTVRAVGAPGNNQNIGFCDATPALGDLVDVLVAGVQGVAAGDHHVLFRTGKGEVWALGANAAGQLGLGTATAVECVQPVPPTAVRGVVALAGGAEHSLALVQGVLETTPAVTLDFGPHPLAHAVSQPLTVQNTGLVPVSFAGLHTNGDFTAADQCAPGPLAPGASCTITVTFTPAGSGARTGSLDIASNAVNASLPVQLVGSTTEPKATFSTTELDFSTIAVGAKSAPQKVTLTSAGNAPLEISNILATAGFELGSDNCPRLPSVLAPQATCDIDVVFAPTVTGPAIGELQVIHAAGTASLRLKGIGQ